MRFYPGINHQNFHTLRLTELRSLVEFMVQQSQQR